MRTPYVIMRRSAMCEHQRMSILSNELVRRLSNVHQEVVQEEITNIIEHYTVQLKTSGYDRKQAVEVISSGVKGWRRKIKRREKDGIPFYRIASSTINARLRRNC